jgi:hypothetical protein
MFGLSTLFLLVAILLLSSSEAASNPTPSPLPEYCGSEDSYEIPPLRTSLSLKIIQLQGKPIKVVFFLDIIPC